MATITVCESASEVINRVTGHRPSSSTAWHPGRRRCPYQADHVPAIVSALEAEADRLSHRAETRKQEAAAEENRHWMRDARSTAYKAEVFRAIAAKIAKSV